jgi:hypothetical protein
MICHNQSRQLMSTYTMSRDFNGRESKFIMINPNDPTKVIVSDPFEKGSAKTMDLLLWLSWPLWIYRNLNQSFHIGRDYICEFRSGKLETLRYFGNGVFSKITDKEVEFLSSDDTDFNKFNPLTFDLGSFRKVGTQEIKPNLRSIVWTGFNLREVIDLIGLYKEGFEKWFDSDWNKYKDYVHQHGDIIKYFYHDGSHINLPVGTIIKEGLVGNVHIVTPNDK